MTKEFLHAQIQKARIEAIENFVQSIITCSSRCACCKYNHSGTCWFSYRCIKNDFINWEEED